MSPPFVAALTSSSWLSSFSRTYIGFQFLVEVLPKNLANKVPANKELHVRQLNFWGSSRTRGPSAVICLNKPLLNLMKLAYDRVDIISGITAAGW